MLSPNNCLLVRKESPFVFLEFAQSENSRFLSLPPLLPLLAWYEYELLDEHSHSIVTLNGSGLAPVVNLRTLDFFLL